jgi:hypothetical protein
LQPDRKAAGGSAVVLASWLAVIYDLLFKASAETLITIAADPKHLGAQLPVVLSPEEVARFLDAAPGLKYNGSAVPS